MKCPNCGCEFDEGIFCPECGTKVIGNDVNPQEVDTQNENVSRPEEAVAGTESVQEPTVPEQAEEAPMGVPSPETAPAKGKKTKENKAKEKAPKAQKAPKAKKEKKKGGCLKAVLIVLGVFIALIILICLIPTGSSSSSSSSSTTAAAVAGDTAENTDEAGTVTNEGSTTENSVTESENTEVTDEKGSWMPSFPDGVSSNYDTSYKRMVSPDDVIADFHKEGFEYVYLEDHEVTADSDNDYAGTSDMINLICTHVDENGLWYLTESVETYYTYWGDDSGEWLHGLGAGEILGYSLEGFNGSHWSMLETNDHLLELAYDIFGEELDILEEEDFSRDYDYDHYVEDLNLSMYFTLDNFQSFIAEELPTDWNHYLDNYKSVTFTHNSNDISNINVTLVVEGNVYEKTINPEEVAYTYAKKDMYFRISSIDEGKVSLSLCYNPGKTKDMVPDIFDDYMVYLTEDEYTTALQTAIDKGEQASEVAQKAGGVTYDNPYEREYSKILDDIDERAMSAYYSLYDINGNGICELIVSRGLNDANFHNTVYTNQGPNYDYHCMNLGHIDSPQTFYAAPDGNGIYAVYGHMGHEIITRLTLATDAWSLKKEVISDRDIDFANGEEYYSNDMPIEESDIEDRTLLHQVTASMYSGESSSSSASNSSSTDNGGSDSSQSSSTSTDYILPDSDSRYYTTSELSGLTKDELRIARNEIYARHGRMFDSADLDEYFRSKPWYTPTIAASQFDEKVLNDYEKKNAELIKSIENN